MSEEECPERLSMWDGEYETECGLPLNHRELHCDGAYHWATDDSTEFIVACDCT